MQNIYPLFERNRILKKELLQSLRDYSFTHVQLEYQEYGQGIIRGCEVVVDGDELVVKSGIIKYGNYICLLMGEEKVPYAPDDSMQYLKIRVEVDHSCQDYILYKAELILGLNGVQKENEFELCRFNLREGARLRDHYTGLSDMVTEYDTINLLYASWGGLGGESMAPAVTRCFSERLLAGRGSLPEDRMFAYLCLSQPGAVPPAVIAGYISQRAKGQIGKTMDHLKLYHVMCEIDSEVSLNCRCERKMTKERHTITVD